MSNILELIVKSAKQTQKLEEKVDLQDMNADKTDVDMAAQLESKKRKVRKEAEEKDKEDVVSEEQEVEDENNVASDNTKIEKGLDVVDEEDEKEDDEVVSEAEEKDDEDVVEESEEKDDEEEMKESEEKKDDEQSEEDELEKDKVQIEKKLKKESKELAVHMNALFSGEKDLSETFKKKAKTIFEAAVVNLASKVLFETNKEMKKQYARKLDTFKESYQSKMVDKVDGYMDKIVQEWWEANKVSARRNIKLELAESFLNNIKKVFNEHYINVDEDKVDVLTQLSEKAEHLESTLNKEINNNLKLSRQIASLKKEIILNEQADGLSENQKEKLKALSEGLEYVNDKEYTSKVKEIVESYFVENAVVNTIEADDTPVEVKEEAPAQVLSEGQAYAEAISKLMGGKKSKTINNQK